MINENRVFLEELISIPSPSGNEFEIQKKFCQNLKKHSDNLITDNAGNAIAMINPENDFKVMIAAHCDEVAFIVQFITDDGMIHVKKSGGIKQVLALGKSVMVMGYGGKLNGVVGASANLKSEGGSEVKIEDIYIDVGAKTKEELKSLVRVGDYIVYKEKYHYLLNDRMAGRGLDNSTGVYIIGELFKKLSLDKPSIGVYGASTVNEETNMFGAYSVAETVKPNIAIICDVTYATDYPDNDNRKDGDVKLGHGPVLSFGSPINKKINDKLIEVAKENDINLQHELTPSSTGTDADKIRFTNGGVPSALVSIPLRYMHSPMEVVSLSDLDKCVELLKAFVLSLDSSFDVKPLNIKEL